MLKFLAANIGLTQTPLRSAMDKSHETRHFKAGETRVGLAWHISKGKSGDVIWHNGGTGGYRTFAGFVKETQKGVVVFTNSTEGADDIGFKLLNPGAMLNPVKASIVPTFRKILDSLGADAAIAHYKDVRGRPGRRIRFFRARIKCAWILPISKQIYRRRWQSLN